MLFTRIIDTSTTVGATRSRKAKIEALQELLAELDPADTGIVVSCQNERSQHRNRDAAMKVLRSRLYDRKQKEQQAKLDEIGGEKKKIGFGSQIRSYVLHPYQMVKDLRTKLEVGAVDRVLDGDFDPFIKAYLMQKAAAAHGAGAPAKETGDRRQETAGS